MQNVTLIRRRSQLTGNISYMSFDMTTSEFETREQAWINGMLIQDAFPELEADAREFIMTGITAAEWELF